MKYCLSTLRLMNTSEKQVSCQLPSRPSGHSFPIIPRLKSPLKHQCCCKMLCFSSSTFFLIDTVSNWGVFAMIEGDEKRSSSEHSDVRELHGNTYPHTYMPYPTRIMNTGKVYIKSNGRHEGLIWISLKTLRPSLILFRRLSDTESFIQGF